MAFHRQGPGKRPDRLPRPMTRLQIQKLMFPIGHLMKSEVRAIAEQQKLPSAKRKDSQGICFLGKINYNDFIERYLGKRTGKIVELETGKVLGKHNGYWFHTIGQRKGLGLSGGPCSSSKKISSGTLSMFPTVMIRKHSMARLSTCTASTSSPKIHGENLRTRKDHFQDPDTPDFTHGRIRRIGRLVPHRIRQQNPGNRSWTVRSSLRQRPSSLPR